MWFVSVFLTPSELCKSIWQFGVRRMKHTAEVAFVKPSSNSMLGICWWFRWLIKLWFLHCLGSCQEEPRWGQEDWQSPYQIQTIHSRHWHQDESAGSCWTLISSYTQHHGTIGQSYSNVFKSGACFLEILRCRKTSRNMPPTLLQCKSALAVFSNIDSLDTL